MRRNLMRATAGPHPLRAYTSPANPLAEKRLSLSKTRKALRKPYRSGNRQFLSPSKNALHFPARPRHPYCHSSGRRCQSSHIPQWYFPASPSHTSRQAWSQSRQHRERCGLPPSQELHGSPVPLPRQQKLRNPPSCQTPDSPRNSP